MLRIAGILFLLRFVFNKASDALMEKFPAEFSSLKWEKFNIFQQEIGVEFKIQNTTNVDVTLTRVVGVVRHNGTILASVNTAAEIKLEAGKTTGLGIILQLDNSDLANQIADLFDNGGLLNPFFIELVITVNGKNIPLKVEKQLLR